MNSNLKNQDNQSISYPIIDIISTFLNNSLLIKSFTERQIQARGSPGTQCLRDIVYKPTFPCKIMFRLLLINYPSFFITSKKIKNYIFVKIEWFFHLNSSFENQDNQSIPYPIINIISTFLNNSLLIKSFKEG